MRKNTISKRVLMRLTAQANEADIYGRDVLASTLTEQLIKYAGDKVRTSDDDYEYSKEELFEEIKSLFWDAATKVFNYYDDVPDVETVEEIVKSEAVMFIENLDNLFNKPIGKFEPKTPGEESNEGSDEPIDVADEEALNDIDFEDGNEGDEEGEVIETVDDELKEDVGEEEKPLFELDDEPADEQVDDEADESIDETEEAIMDEIDDEEEEKKTEKKSKKQ